MTVILVAFTPDNNIHRIKSRENTGVSLAEMQFVIDGIEDDPLWLQSPADRAADTFTQSEVRLEEYDTS